MLVISRHRDESVMLGDSVCITVIDIRGDRARLGVAAPAEIPIYRPEVSEEQGEPVGSYVGEPSGMIVFSRNRNESIRIGSDVQLTIIDIRGDKIRLGIDTPLELPVHRQEVYDAIKRHQD